MCNAPFVTWYHYKLIKRFANDVIASACQQDTLIVLGYISHLHLSFTNVAKMFVVSSRYLVDRQLKLPDGISTVR